MKIRTDFVTNSSSMSFVTVKLTTLKKIEIEVGLRQDGPRNPMILTDGGKEKVKSFINKNMKNIHTGKDLIELLYLLADDKKDIYDGYVRHNFDALENIENFSDCEIEKIEFEVSCIGKVPGARVIHTYYIIK